MKLSFKRHKKEGRYRSFQQTHIDIKADRKVCGSISEDRDGVWHVLLHVKREPTAADPAPFSNTRLTYRGPSEQVTRDFVINSWDAICKRYDLHQLEN